MPTKLFAILVIVTLCLIFPQCNAEQFSHWYGFYSFTILHQAGPKCYPNYTAGDFPQYVQYLKLEGKINMCKSMVTCLSRNIDEFDKADMQSATIILGLMPTILSYLGPTVGEMALVSCHRPVFAVLVMLGTPAVYATRPFDFNSPSESLKKNLGGFVLHKQIPCRAYFMTLAQYLLLSLAVGNSLHNSVNFGTSTILGWKCLWPYLELGWNLMPVVPHFCAALSLRCSNTYRRPSRKNIENRKRSHITRRWLWNEANPSANHAKLELDTGMPETRTAICLNWVAVILAYAHWIFGTLVFSSALFIGTLDALGVIARYLASALVCRMILLVEIAGIRAVEEGETTQRFALEARDA